MLQLIVILLALNPNGKNYKKLAIVSFDTVEEAGRKVGAARTMSIKDELAKQLMGQLEFELQVDFDIVERTKLEAIRAEHKLSTPEGAKAAWTLLKADSLLTGTITDYNKVAKAFHSQRLNISRSTNYFTLALSFKLIDTQTGQLITVGEALVQLNSRQLRTQGFSDDTAKYALCKKAAVQIRAKISQDLRDRRNRER